jgi:hypothetical protein
MDGGEQTSPHGVRVLTLVLEKLGGRPGVLDTVRIARISHEDNCKDAGGTPHKHRS